VQPQLPVHTGHCQDGGNSTHHPEEEEEEEAWEVERRYWQGFAGKAPVYGSDNYSSTLFEACAGAWNLSRLDSLLRRRLRSTIPGVTSPYLYMGMWRASFAWHVEDMDLYSINYLHYGADKIWYAVPHSEGEKLERLASSIFPDQARVCSQFLRHKSCVMHPSLLLAAGINLTRAVQHAREFVISFPYAYHSGFNAGLNCAEAVNFGSERWVPFGQRSKPCKCFSDSVKIKMSLFSPQAPSRLLSNSDSTIDDIVCEVCGGGHDEHRILLCDNCSSGFHMSCLLPPLSREPAGIWWCPACQAELEEEEEEGGGRGSLAVLQLLICAC